MTDRYLVGASVFGTLAAIFTAGVVGRLTAPAKTVEKIRTVEVERTARAEQTAAKVETRTDVQTVERVVTRYVRTEPSGAREEREETRESGTQREEAKRDEKVVTVVEERVVYKDRDVLKVLERPVVPKPRWLLGASVAPGGKSFYLPGGATVTGGVRVGGPVWVTATGGRLGGEWTGTVGLAVTW